MKNDAPARRSDSGAQPPAAVYEFAGFRFEPTRRTLIGIDGAPVKLSNKSLDALGYFLERAGTLVERDELLHALWPRRVVEANNLNQAIAGLRRALGEGHIATVAGRGYQWVTPVTRSTEFGGGSITPPASAPASAPPIGDRDLTSRPAEVSRTATARRRGYRLLAIVAAAAVAAAWVLIPAHETTALGPVTSVSPITTYPGAETTPSMSPDGARIAFSWDGHSGRRNIYWTAIGTSTPIRLTFGSEGSDEFPAWSPDGESVAFLRRYDPARFDVLIVPAIGGPERKLASGEMLWISVEGFPLLAWTPDSRQLVFTSRVVDGAQGDGDGFALKRLTIATGAVELLVNGGAEGYDTSPAISPNGQWLAFARYRYGERLSSPMVQRLGPNFTAEGEPHAVPSLDPSIYLSLVWGSDGDRLYFAGNGKIFEWQLGGAPRVVQTVGPRLPAPLVTMARHGASTRAAFVAERGDLDIFALPLDPVSHARLGEPVARVLSSGTDQHPRFSPDGTQLAFVSDRNGGTRALWIADANGANARQLTELAELITGYPRWSPDGRHIAFHTSASNEDRVIYEIDMDSGETTRRFSGCCPGGWSADGRYLYVTDQSSPVYYVARIDMADGTRERLFEGEAATESDDGLYLLYSKSRQPGYFRRSLRGSAGENAEERLVEDYRPTRGGLAPVADGFFYVGLTPEGEPRAIRFFDYAGEQARDIAPVSANVGIGLTVSPDGRELLYAATDRPEADIMLYEFATR